MKLRIVLSLLLVCLILAPSTISAAPSQPINPPCTKLGGAFTFAHFGFNPLDSTRASGDGSVWNGDQQIGTFSAQYFNIVQQGKGVTQLNGNHTIRFTDGRVLYTSDEIHLQSDNQTPTLMHANSRLYIVRGEGAYAGATGLLHTHGAFDVAKLTGSITFDGQICVP